MLANNSNNGYLSQWLASRLLCYIHGLQSGVTLAVDVAFTSRQHFIMFNPKNYTRNKIDMSSVIGRRGPLVGDIPVKGV